MLSEWNGKHLNLFFLFLLVLICIIFHIEVWKLQCVAEVPAVNDIAQVLEAA